MLIKEAILRIEANSVIDRDMLLYKPMRNASFIKHDISNNLVFAEKPMEVLSELEDKNPEEWVFFRTRAIDAGGMEKTGEYFWGANDNGDFFSEEQLLAMNDDGKRAFETFIGCPIFANHKNDDIEQSRGKIINAFYDLDNHCVYVDGMVDAKAYPKLARGIRENYINDTSMGCSVKYSICSVCKNKAVSESDYCEHIKNHKGKTINGKKVYEENYGLKFIENSFVTDGACDNCTIQNVLTGPELIDSLKQVLKSGNDNLVSLRKVASLQKEGRGDDIDKLNKSLDLLKEVADQILNSKDVDFEFLEDIGGLLAQLQNLIVDLVEAGFANQVSGEEQPPSETESAEINQLPTGGQSSNELTGPSPSLVPEPTTNIPRASAPESPLISTTSNKEFNKKYGNKMKELKAISLELNKLVQNVELEKEKIRGIDEMPTKKDIARRNASNLISEGFAQMLDEQLADNEPVSVTDGAYSVSFDLEGKKIEAYVANKKVAALSLNDINLGEDLAEMTKITPQVVAGRIIQKLSEKYNENGELKMAQKNIKEALLTQDPPVDKVQERQLADMSGNFDRKNDPEKATGQVGVTTQKQLESIPKTPETGKGDFNRVRPDDVKENLEVQEGQLDNARPTKFGVERDADDPNKPVQEDQLKGSGFGSERWENERADADLPIFEGQFEGKDRQGEAVDEVFEGQLKGHRTGTDSEVSSDASPHRANNHSKIIEAMIDGLANVTVNNMVTPKTLVASAKITPAGIMSRSAVKLSKNQKLSAKDITKLAEFEISEEIGETENMDEYIAEVIEVLFGNKEKLEAAVSNAAKKKIEAIKSLRSETVEAERKSAISDAWNKRIAGDTYKELSISPNDLSEAFRTKNVGALDESAIIKYVSSKHPNSTITKVEKTANGGWTATLSDREEVSTEQQINQLQPAADPTIDEQITENDMSDVDIEQPALALSADVVEKLQKIAETKKMNKKAQNPNGTTLPPPGGAPGAEMGGPAGGLEDLGGTPPPMDDLGGDFEEELAEEGEAVPFGSKCPACMSEDVDVMDGKYHCDSCGLNYDIEVNLRALNPEVLTGIGTEEAESGEEESEGEDINDQINEEPAAAAPAPPAAAPMGAEMPGMAAHSNGWLRTASLRYTFSNVDPLTFVTKGAKRKVGKAGPIGTSCPQCSSLKVAFKDSEGTCVACGCKSHVATKKNNGKLDVVMTWEPNLTLAKEEKFYPNGKSAGFGITADCEDCDEVKKALHEILSSRENLVKIASATEEDNPMLACMSDQIATGYTDEDSIEICASVKTAIEKMMLKKQGLLEEDDDDDEVENESVDEPVIEDDDDDDEFEIEEVETDDDEEDDFVEFESEEEDDEDAVELEDEGNGEAANFGDVSEVQEVNIKFKDGQGNEGEFTLSVDEAGESDIPDDIEEVVIEEEITDEPDMFEETPEEDDLEEDGFEETSDDEILQSFFTDGTRAVVEEEAEAPQQLNAEESRMVAKNTSEFLRGDAVASSNRSGGSNLDMEKLAQAVGIQMPLDIDADVPRDEEQGIVEDGDVEVHTTEHKNEAKEIKGTAAGSTIAEDDAVEGPERGVEVIEPQAVAKSKNKIKKAQIDLADPPPASISPEVGRDPLLEDSGIVDEEDPFINSLVEAITALVGNISPEEKEKVLEEVRGQVSFDDEFPMEDLSMQVAGKKLILKKVAQVRQLEPVDSLQEEKVEEETEDKPNVPRDESKAKPEIDVNRPDVDSPDEIREKEYELGPGATNLHNDAIVPRDGSGDGIGGKKPKFDQESGDKQTSGNSDNYVQEFQGIIDPTPVSSEDNHLGASAKKAVIKVAKAKGLKLKNIKVAEKEDHILVKDATSGKTYKIAKKCKDCKCSPCECKKKECDKCKCDPCECKKEANIKKEIKIATKADAIKKVAEAKGLSVDRLEATDIGTEDGYIFVADLDSDKMFRVKISE